jgi:hypothetical protein
MDKPKSDEKINENKWPVYTNIENSHHAVSYDAMQAKLGSILTVSHGVVRHVAIQK